MELVIVGNAGGTNVGASLQRAASICGIESSLADACAATAGPRLAVSLCYRLLGRRPLHLRDFGRRVVDECRRLRPRVLIATGQAPLDLQSLAEIGQMNIRRVNYSTDDPWNPLHRAAWFLDTLPHYDRVHSTRQANLEDFRRAGCGEVSWLPFGYDRELWVSGPEPPPPVPQADGPAEVFFAGAAESYRVECLRALIAARVRVAIAGDFWKRIPDLRKYCTGHLSAQQLRAWTRATPLALCLVRRANRDGHVMRSFEIPAIGTCMIAEDTSEHRAIFGADGAAVRYFRSPAEAVAVVRELLTDPAAAGKLAAAAHALVTGAANTYADRLRTLCESSVRPGEGGSR